MVTGTGRDETTKQGRLAIAALLTASTISQVGNTLTHIAVLWFVLETTGSPARAGVAGVFMALPIAVSGVVGGSVVDRLGFRRTSIISDLASGIAVALIPALYYTSGLTYWQLLLLILRKPAPSASNVRMR